MRAVTIYSKSRPPSKDGKPRPAVIEIGDQIHRPRFHKYSPRNAARVRAAALHCGMRLHSITRFSETYIGEHPDDLRFRQQLGAVEAEAHRDWIAEYANATELAEAGYTAEKIEDTLAARYDLQNRCSRCSASIVSTDGYPIAYALCETGHAWKWDGKRWNATETHKVLCENDSA